MAGYGENLRVLKWITDRAKGKASAVKTPIGYVPPPESIDVEGLSLQAAQWRSFCGWMLMDGLKSSRRPSHFSSLSEKSFQNRLWREYHNLVSRLEKEKNAV